MITLQEFLVRHTARMMHCFFLEHIEVYFQRCKKLEGRMFDIYVDYEYLRARIRYGEVVARLWKEKESKEILAGIAHELTHILTGEITEDLKITKHRRHMEERATEHISRLLLRLYLKESGQ